MKTHILQHKKYACFLLYHPSFSLEKIEELEQFLSLILVLIFVYFLVEDIRQGS